MIRGRFCTIRSPWWNLYIFIWFKSWLIKEWYERFGDYNWLVRKLCENLGDYKWLVRKMCKILSDYTWLVRQLYAVLSDYSWLVRNCVKSSSITPPGPTWPLVALFGVPWPHVASVQHM